MPRGITMITLKQNQLRRQTLDDFVDSTPSDLLLPRRGPVESQRTCCSSPSGLPPTGEDPGQQARGVGGLEGADPGSLGAGIEDVAVAAMEDLARGQHPYFSVRGRHCA